MRPEPPGDATSVLSLPPSPHPRHCLSNVTEWSQRRACPNHDLENLGPKGNCPSCTRSICWIYEQRRSTQGSSPWLIPGGRQHTTVHTPRTCFLCSCPCSRKSLKQTYTQVGPRHHALLLTIRNSQHHLLTGLSQTQGAGVTLCQEPSRWSRATCFSEARRRQELDLRWPQSSSSEVLSVPHETPKQGSLT